MPRGADSKICFVGDLIDHGEGSFEVVQLAMRRGYAAVMGNHEYRLLQYKDAFLRGETPSNPRWFYLNGGAQTFASYDKASRVQKLAHIEFLSNLPLYLEFAEFKNAQGRRLFVSHSAIGRMWPLRNLDGDSEAEFRRHVLCGRGNFSQNEGVFNVYGHTPIAKPDVTNFSANVDIGCVYKHDFGRLCALEFPSMRVFMQENIEEGG
ncbi:metallophosphatase [Campylobacter concisus]|uniref:Metallophosphatase n=1 Tax=Campylobacter concisus TaxID=199 RepID=A0A0M4SHT3_9BACT|nr:metallophosphatase [Campylobacter concisus]